MCFFPLQRHGSYCAKLTRILSRWPGQGLAKCFGSRSWCVGIIWLSFWQEATGPLPVSNFQTRFPSSTDVPDNIVQNQPRSDLVLADCVRFWPNGSDLEASWCARIIQPTSGQCFPANLDLMQIGSGKFTWEAALEESAAQVLCTEARSAFQLMSRNMFGCCAK